MAHPATKDIAVSAKGEAPLYESTRSKSRKEMQVSFFFFFNKWYKSQEASEPNKFQPNLMKRYQKQSKGADVCMQFKTNFKTETKKKLYQPAFRKTDNLR